MLQPLQFPSNFRVSKPGSAENFPSTQNQARREKIPGSLVLSPNTKEYNYGVDSTWGWQHSYVLYRKRIQQLLVPTFGICQQVFCEADHQDYCHDRYKTIFGH